MSSRKNKIVVLMMMLFMAPCVLCACSSADADAVYEYASEALGEATDEELGMLADGTLGVDYMFGVYGGNSLSVDGTGGSVRGGIYGLMSALCSSAKRWGPMVIIGSVVIGFVMIRLAPKAIKVRRTAWLVFIIGIPFLVLFVIFGSAFLADAFAN